MEILNFLCLIDGFVSKHCDDALLIESEGYLSAQAIRYIVEDLGLIVEGRNREKDEDGVPQSVLYARGESGLVECRNKTTQMELATRGTHDIKIIYEGFSVTPIGVEMKAIDAQGLRPPKYARLRKDLCRVLSDSYACCWWVMDVDAFNLLLTPDGTPALTSVFHFMDQDKHKGPARETLKRLFVDLAFSPGIVPVAGQWRVMGRKFLDGAHLALAVRRSETCSGSTYRFAPMRSAP